MLKKIDKQIEEKLKQMDQEVFKDKSREECEYILKWLTERQPVQIDFLRKLIWYNKKYMLDIIREKRLAIISLNDKSLIVDPADKDSEKIIKDFIEKNKQQIKKATCFTNCGDCFAGKDVFIEQLPLEPQSPNRELTLLLPNMKPLSGLGAVNKDDIRNNFEFHKHILKPFFEKVNELNSKKRNKKSKIKTVMLAGSFGNLPLAKCLKYVINNLKIDLDSVHFSYPATNMFGFLGYQTINDVKNELNDLGQGSKARIKKLYVKNYRDENVPITVDVFDYFIHPKSSFEDLKNFFKDKKEKGSDFWKGIDMHFNYKGKRENIKPEKTKFKTNEHLVNTKKEIEEKQETKESQDLENKETIFSLEILNQIKEQEKKDHENRCLCCF